MVGVKEKILESEKLNHFTKRPFSLPVYRDLLSRPHRQESFVTQYKSRIRVGERIFQQSQETTDGLILYLYEVTLWLKKSRHDQI